MIPLGILNQVDGYTFVYSGNLQLGDKNYIVVAFETKLRTGGSKFEIKQVESKGEMEVVIKSFQVKEEPKPKKVVWDDTKIEVPKKPNKSLSLF
jgi:hypothetical protein